MEYKMDNGAAGSVPEFGAIFMSSIVTKKECFKHNIFALPLSMAEFVKQVKAGMVLFLFEFEKRQLYGVYRAFSDGAMDIAPHLFSNSGKKRFPAQVPFTQIWRCNPLPEKVFRDAIKENYFSPKKFNFGLSQAQVHRLLYLFSSRKLNKLPSLPLPQIVDVIYGQDREQACSDTFPSSVGQYIDSAKHQGFKPVVCHDRQMNSLDRGNEDEFLIESGDIGGGKLYPLGQGDILAKRRRVNKGDELFRNDVADSEIYSNDIRHSFPCDSPEDSSDEVDRLDSTRRLSRIVRVLKENQLDKLHDSVLHSEYPMSSSEGRAIDVDQFMQRNKFLSEDNIAHGFGPAFTGECYGNHLDQTKPQSERYLFDKCILEQDACDIVKPTIFGDDKVHPFLQSREVIDDRQRSLTRKLKNSDYIDHSGKHVSYLNCSASVLHKVKSTKVGEDIPAQCRIHREPVLILSSMESIPSDNSVRPMNSDQRLFNNGRHLNVGGRVVVDAMDDTLFSAGSSRNAGHYRSVEGRVVDGKYRMSQRAGDTEDIDTHSSPIVSKVYPSLSDQKENMSTFFDRIPERVLSQLNDNKKFEPSGSRFKDATITRVVPYVPEYPGFPHGYSASSAANNGTSGLMQEKPYYTHRFERHSPSSKIGLPYSLGSAISTRAKDISPECQVNALPSDTSSQQSFNRCYSPFHNSNLPRHTLVGNKHSQQQEKDTLIGNNMTNDIGTCVSDYARGLAGNQNQFSGMSCNRNDKGYHVSSEAPPFNSNGNRRSVFTRLSTRRESWVAKDTSDIKSGHYDYFMNTSADEIMEMLQRDDNVKNMNSRLVGKPKHGESDVGGKQIQLHAEANQSKKKIEETHLAVEDRLDLPKETRIVNFKRRSGTKRTVVHNRNDSAVGLNKEMDHTCNDSTVVHNRNDSAVGLNKEVDHTCNDPTEDRKVNEVVDKPAKITLKRRRLIRPIFGKVETATSTIGSNEDSQLLVLHHKDDKQGNEVEQGNRNNEVQFLGAAVCSNENSQILDLRTDDIQNCKKVICSSEIKMPNAMCSKDDSLFLVLNKNDEQNCNCEKGTGCSETELPNAVCSNVNSWAVVLHMKVEQNCEKAVSSTEADMPDVVCCSQDSQFMCLHKDVEQNFQKAISNSEAEMSDALHNEDSLFLGNCEKAICSSEVDMPDAVCNNGEPQLLVPCKDDKCITEDSQLLVLQKDDKQNTNKVINQNAAVLLDHDASFGCLVASDSHHLLKGNTEEHPKQIQDDVRANVFPSTSLELKGHETLAIDPQVGSSDLPKEASSL